MKKRDLDGLRYDGRGLVPVVVQEFNTGAVLMVAWMNADSLSRTLESGYTHFWSRSRRKLWKKGETSGHLQKVREIKADCDGDTLLVLVEQTGPACHTNSYSCFTTPLYSSGGEGPEGAEILEALYRVIMDRKHRRPEGSYVLSLLEGGGEKMVEKVMEEAGEVAAASRSGDRKELTHEIADLWFHTLVLLGGHDIPPAGIFRELAGRYRPESRD